MNRTSTPVAEHATTDLLSRYQALKAERPSLRQRDAADALGASEADLVAVLPEAMALRGDFNALLEALTLAGEIKCITRNRFCVQERVGQLRNLSLGTDMGLALDQGGLDLRFYLKNWRRAFAVSQQSRRGALHSVQFYDDHGDAIGKFYLHDDARLDDWQAMVAAFAGAGDSDRPRTPRAGLPHRDLGGDDLARFREEWLALQDIHHFNRLLVRYDMSRRSAFASAPEGYAEKLAVNSIEALLRRAADEQTPIMIFTGNRGMVQIHGGPIVNVKEMDGWLNIFDKALTLHLDPSGIDSVWRVKRPTRDGIITAVEALDANGDTILTLFGLRSEGQREDPAWHAMAQSAAPQETHRAA
ncbi:hemin-degrading factor [Paludibacterium paludis]|uniref:Hemin-degrading factor n=1 Tax=Paludibacterium paludis TaxID=1225769 RepID=A0A918UBN9_9NEIS|nr:ChuX/HutX family heme-like substrate-binding protein [Paludibacterium paludis]GGY25664.1 hemin-degrading factor [Paludibacterium paludis]